MSERRDEKGRDDRDVAALVTNSKAAVPFVTAFLVTSAQRVVTSAASSRLIARSGA
jgi:hypothetical protein